MVEGVKDYRGQRHIMSWCALPAQSSLNVAAVPRCVLGDFGFLSGGQSPALGLDVKLWDATAASIFIELRAAPQLRETHPSSNWGCFTPIPRTSSEQASSYNRCLKKVTSGAAEQVKKPFDLQAGGVGEGSPNKSRASPAALKGETFSVLIKKCKKM